MDESSRTSRTFHAAGLSRARSLFRKMVKYFICLPTDRLWELYSLNYRLLAEVKSCLDEIGWLSNEREWDNTNGEKINREHFAGWSEGVSQVKTFVFFSYLFNMVLEYHQLRGCGTSVKETIRTGFVEPGPTGTSEHSPDAFLHMAVKTPSTPGKSRWRDLIYLFKYKFGDDDAVNNDNMALLNLYYIMRDEPRRMFSFGFTVHETKLPVWLSCRATLFTFTSFDSFEASAAFVLRVFPRHLLRNGPRF